MSITGSMAQSLYALYFQGACKASAPALVHLRLLSSSQRCPHFCFSGAVYLGVGFTAGIFESVYQQHCKSKNGAIFKLRDGIPHGKCTENHFRPGSLELAVDSRLWKNFRPTFRTGRKTGYGVFELEAGKELEIQFDAPACFIRANPKCARAQEKYVFSGGLWCTVWKR